MSILNISTWTMLEKRVVIAKTAARLKKEVQK